MTRVLVFGGRDFAERDFAFSWLTWLHAHFRFEVLIQGEARGADLIGKSWAQTNGVPTLDFPADWDGLGKSAGILRNKQMLEVGRPTLGVGFAGGRGTADMAARLVAAGVTLIQPGGSRS